MAKDKKGFVLYADLIYTVEELTDDEAGRLLKHILQYVNDKNPVAPDKITKISFEPIKQQLKRDLKKYEVIKEKRRQIGRAGGLKSGEERSKTKQNEAIASILKQNEANEAVTVTDTVKVKDTDTDTVINVSKAHEIFLPFNSVEFKVAWYGWKKYLQDEWKIKYQSFSSEQAALKELNDLSEKSEAKALHLINWNMSKRYKNFYQDKDYGKQQQPTREDQRQSIKNLGQNALDELLRSSNSSDG